MLVSCSLGKVRCFELYIGGRRLAKRSKIQSQGRVITGTRRCEISETSNEYASLTVHAILRLGKIGTEMNNEVNYPVHMHNCRGLRAHGSSLQAHQVFVGFSSPLAHVQVFVGVKLSYQALLENFTVTLTIALFKSPAIFVGRHFRGQRFSWAA